MEFPKLSPNDGEETKTTFANAVAESVLNLRTAVQYILDWADMVNLDLDGLYSQLAEDCKDCDEEQGGDDQPMTCTCGPDLCSECPANYDAYDAEEVPVPSSIAFLRERLDDSKLTLTKRVEIAQFLAQVGY